MPHSELFGSRLNVSFKDFVKPFCRFFFLFSFWISLSRQHVAAFSSVELPPVLKVCWSWVETVTDDSDWPPEKMLYSSLIGKTEAWNKYKETVRVGGLSWLSQSLSASHHLSMTFSCCLFFSHFSKTTLEKKKKGCWAVQTALSFKICPCAISLSSSCLWKTFSVFPCPLRSRQTAPHSFSSHCQVISERRRIETALKHTVRYISSFVFHATLRCCCFM